MPSPKSFISPRIPQYRLHAPSGLAVVRLSGRDVYLGPHQSPESHAKYRKVVAEWLASSKREPLSPRATDRPATINELVLAYLDFAKGYYLRDGHPTREVTNIRYAVRPLVELYGSEPVAAFGPLSLKAVREHMMGLDWCRRVVNARVNLVRRVFKWGVENELVPPTILHGLQAVAGLKLGRCSVRESEPVRPVPDVHIEAVVAAAPRAVAAMVQVQRLTGMRPGELVIMRTRDIDASGRIWTYTPMRHKTEVHGKARVVYLGPAAQRVLRPLLRKDLDVFLFSPRDALDERAAEARRLRQTPLTPSQRARRRKINRSRPPGERYTTLTYARAVWYACDRAFPHPNIRPSYGIGMTTAQRQELQDWRRAHRWSPNQLRHTAATALRKQFGIEAARVVLGHSSAGVTEIYAEQDFARAAEIMGRVG